MLVEEERAIYKTIQKNQTYLRPQKKWYCKLLKSCNASNTSDFTSSLLLPPVVLPDVCPSSLVVSLALLINSRNASSLHGDFDGAGVGLNVGITLGYELGKEVGTRVHGVDAKHS